MIIGSIDYSLNSPCVTVFTGGIFKFQNCQSHYLNSIKRLTGKFKNITGHYYEPSSNQMERYIHIGTWAYELVKSCDAVILEDYSMGSRGKVFNIAENTAILKYLLHINNVPLQTLPPTKVKKFATGKGNADKNLMYEYLIKDTGMDLKALFGCKGKNIVSPISDIVDSFYLLKFLESNHGVR